MVTVEPMAALARSQRLAAVLLTAITLLPACRSGGEEAAASFTPPPPVSPVATPSPSGPISPPPPPASPVATKGPATDVCVNGWVTPRSGTARYTEPLGVIRRTTGVGGPLVVTDMRYLEGPESPVSEMGYLAVVQRWYVRLYARDDPAFQGRFLVEARRFGQGVSAVAAYDTHGWRSPDWIGFQYDSADAEPKAYAGLPGMWSGIPYDFVKGGGGIEIPGLPDAVVGCLAGT